MNSIEKIEQSIGCCAEFCCDECTYKQYDDREQYTMRCIYLLMQDIKKVYVDNYIERGEIINER